MATGLSRKELEDTFHKYFDESLLKLKSPNDGGGEIARKINSLTNDGMTGVLIGFIISAMLNTIADNNKAII